MIDQVDTMPDVDVRPAEYKRLLGYPAARGLSPRARQLARWARAWYVKHGRPWTYVRQARELDCSNGSVMVDGVSLTSERLRDTLRQADAHCVALAAVSAGPEIEQEAQRAWQEGKPDEYFFLEVFGSAVVEHLTTMIGASICAWAEGRGMAVLPHYSPGYSGWDVAEQPRLMELVRQSRTRTLPGELDILESGMLRPKKSLLAVFGITRRVDRVERLSGLIPCEACAFHPCQYRRRPYERATTEPRPTPATLEDATAAETTATPPLQLAAKYTVNQQALRRWTAQRLAIHERPNGTTDAVFRYEGTTCTNLGRTLYFEYRVTLGPRDDGYPIRSQHCGPAHDDNGYVSMCGYLENPDELMQAIVGDQPLLGRPLDDVLTWKPPTTAAGCYCTAEDRLHKWRIVLETIHYALAERERGGQLSEPARTVLT